MGRVLKSGTAFGLVALSGLLFSSFSAPTAWALEKTEASMASKPKSDGFMGQVQKEFSAGLSRLVQRPVATEGASELVSRAVLPAPQTVRAETGAVRLTSLTPIQVAAEDVFAQQSALRAAAWIGLSKGTRPPVLIGEDGAGGPKGPRVHVARLSKGTLGPELAAGLKSEEAYRVRITQDGVWLEAETDQGLAHAVSTYWQLVAYAPAQKTSSGQAWATVLPAMTVVDAPRLAWRGILLDSARHYQPVSFIKTFLDAMAVAKLNRFHWHLTDDQAWRLEIKKYPRLAQIGGCRVPAGAAQRDMDPATGKPRLYCGTYSQDEVRDVVAYAARLGIMVVPEVGAPGHASAAIVAYPELATTSTPPKQVPADWGVYDNVYNPSDASIGMLKDVLDEVMDLFPSPYIHIGGDEAQMRQWLSDPKTRVIMDREGLKTGHDVQAYILSKLGAHVVSKGRKIIGWDEILEGKLPEGVTIMSWRGIEGAITAAKMGNDTILSPNDPLYLDHRQSDSVLEPPGRGKVTPLAEMYSFNPLPQTLTPQQQSHVLGLQANLWTEHVRTPERAWQMAFPRALAVGEVGWSSPATHNEQAFFDRAAVNLIRLKELGAKPSEAAYRPEIKGYLPAESGQKATLRLTRQAQSGEVRYTIDGSDPSPTSALYTVPVEVALGATVKARTYLNGAPLTAINSRVLSEQALETRDSRELALCQNKLSLVLEDDGPIGTTDITVRRPIVTDIMAPCWMWKGADLSNIAGLQVKVGQLPFNFQIGDDIKKIKIEAARLPEGEMVVRENGCAGPELVRVPLTGIEQRTDLATLMAGLPRRKGRTDLCFTFTATKSDPTGLTNLTVLSEVTLVPAQAARPEGETAQTVAPVSAPVSAAPKNPVTSVPGKP